MSARHAATDGSFGRSAGGAAARGAGLLLVAVVLGILLLRSGGGDPYTRAIGAAATDDIPATTITLPTATTVTVPVRNPADVKVLPVNGTGTAGAGLAAGNRLKDAKYNVLAATNTTKQVTTSNVFYATGYEREARVVAQLLGLADSSAQPIPSPPPVSDTKDANLIVVVGPDFPGGAPATSTPATTARRSTATTSVTARTTTTARTSTTRAASATTTTR